MKSLIISGLVGLSAILGQTPGQGVLEKTQEGRTQPRTQQKGQVQPGRTQPGQPVRTLPAQEQPGQAIPGTQPQAGQIQPGQPQPGQPTLNQAQNQQRGTPQQIDGSWNVTYVEMEGKKAKDRSYSEVTIKNNVLTCKHDGETKSWRLEFMPHHMVRATELDQASAKNQQGNREGQANETPSSSNQSPKVSQGTYVASNEYLVLSVNRADGSQGNQGRPQQGRNQTGTNQQQENQQANQAQQVPQQPGTPSTTSATAQSQSPRSCEFVLILHRNHNEGSNRNQNDNSTRDQ